MNWFTSNIPNNTTDIKCNLEFDVFDLEYD